MGVTLSWYPNDGKSGYFFLIYVLMAVIPSLSTAICSIIQFSRSSGFNCSRCFQILLSVPGEAFGIFVFSVLTPAFSLWGMMDFPRFKGIAKNKYLQLLLQWAMAGQNATVIMQRITAINYRFSALIDESEEKLMALNVITFINEVAKCRNHGDRKVVISYSELKFTSNRPRYMVYYGLTVFVCNIMIIDISMIWGEVNGHSAGFAVIIPVIVWNLWEIMHIYLDCKRFRIYNLVTNLLPFMEEWETLEIIAGDGLKVLFGRRASMMECVQTMYQILYRESVVGLVTESTPLDIDLARIVEDFLIDVLPEYDSDFKQVIERLAPSSHGNRSLSVRTEASVESQDYNDERSWWR